MVQLELEIAQGTAGGRRGIVLKFVCLSIIVRATIKHKEGMFCKN